PGTQGQIRQPIESVPRTLCMDRRECSTVARVDGLQEVIARFVAYYAHDDAVGPVAESSGHKLARSDGNLAGDGIDGLPANGVRMGYLQFGGLLNDDQTFVERHMVKQRFHQGCLATASSAADDSVLPLGNEPYDFIPNQLR